MFVPCAGKDYAICGKGNGEGVDGASSDDGASNMTNLNLTGGIGIRALTPFHPFPLL